VSFRFLLPVLGLVALSACNPGPTPAAAERRAEAPPAPEAHPTHVDSFIPRDEALRRFRRGLASVEGLKHGLPSRDALVQAFVRALERRDSTALGRLALSKAEFAYLFYPSSPQGLPPYDLNPDLMWFMLSLQSDKGVRRALTERGGRPLHAAGFRCDGKPSGQGENTVWGPCVLRRVTAQGDTIEERLFGPILDRRGRYKFVSYANKL
jgi:hypothetical protein